MFESAARLAHPNCQLIHLLAPSIATQPKYLAGCQCGILVSSHPVEAPSRLPAWQFIHLSPRPCIQVATSYTSTKELGQGHTLEAERGGHP